MVIATIYYTRGTIKASREANVPAPLSTTLLRAGTVLLELDIYVGLILVYN